MIPQAADVDAELDRRRTYEATERMADSKNHCTAAGDDRLTDRRLARRARLVDAALPYVRSGSGPTVVLLHPLRCQLEYWSPLIRALGAGLDVVALDLPGHGCADAPYADYSAAYFIDEVAQFLEVCDVANALLVGESIGGVIALALAARANPRVARVVAINPYDYAGGMGIRRSSVLAAVLFPLFARPLVGSVVLRAGPKPILRRLLEGGLHDPRRLPPALVDQLWRCGWLPGHPRAFLSLCRHAASWSDARAAYSSVRAPTVLVYGDHDWSHPAERVVTTRAVAASRTVMLPECGHFASLEHPAIVARLVRAEAALLGRG